MALLIIHHFWPHENKHIPSISILSYQYQMRHTTHAGEKHLVADLLYRGDKSCIVVFVPLCIHLFSSTLILFSLFFTPIAPPFSSWCDICPRRNEHPLLVTSITFFFQLEAGVKVVFWFCHSRTYQMSLLHKKQKYKISQMRAHIVLFTTYFRKQKCI